MSIYFIYNSRSAAMAENNQNDVMPRSQDPELYDLLISSYAHTLYQINISFLEEGSLTCLKEPLPIKLNA